MQYCTNNFYPYIHEHNSLMPSLKWLKFKLISHIITGFSNYIDSILDSNILQTLWQKPEIFDDARQVQGGTSSVKTASHPVETVSISPIGRGRASKAQANPWTRSVLVHVWRGRTVVKLKTCVEAWVLGLGFSNFKGL